MFNRMKRLEWGKIVYEWQPLTTGLGKAGNNAMSVHCNRGLATPRPGQMSAATGLKTLPLASQRSWTPIYRPGDIRA